KIKKKSRVPGVMITQYVESLPEGMSTPDFTRKPIALTIQEKVAVFKAIVTGNPTPAVTWVRTNGEIDGERYKIVFDAISGEHQLQMPDVSVDQADVYKCFARNEYGKAVVTVTLNIIEGFKKSKAMQQSRTVREIPEDFKKTLRSIEPREEKKLEIDDKFWELLLSADKKDYESICAQYGITDFRWMLKKLSEKKQEREQEQQKVVEKLCNLKPIELKPTGSAEFEFEMSLKDPNSKIFLFKDGVMIPFDADAEVKHGLKRVGNKFVFSIDGVNPEDAGLYQVEVDGVKIFSTDLKPVADFLVKIQDVKAEEREDAVFQCVISHPMQKITWMGKNLAVEQGEKYDITVSEDKLIHTLVVKDCLPLDKGIYTAVIGLKSCSAWLIVEKKAARKTTKAGGGGDDLLKIAQEQQVKLQKEREEIIAKVKEEAASKSAEEPESKDQTPKVEVKKEPKVELPAKGDDDVGEKPQEPASTENKAEEEEPVQETKKRVRTGPLVPDTVTPGVYFTSGLSDVTAIIGTEAELVCRLSSEDCDAVWYKDGKEIAETEDISIVKDGTYRKLVIKNCKEEDAGKYRCEADGRKTEAMFIAEPPRFNSDDLAEFMKPITIKTGKDAAFKLTFVGSEPMKIQWYHDGEELVEDTNVKIEKSSSHSRLHLTKCQRKASGEIKIKVKNQWGTNEAITQLTVLKPTPPLGPVEIIESSSSCIEFKWRPPKDNGGLPITNYILERQQVGRNSWKKLGKIGPEAKYKDTDVDHGRKYCYHIRAETDHGISEMMETDDIQAGTKYPGPPSIPKIVSAFKDCINLAWTPPANTGGTNILGYNVEKRKNGSNLWNMVNPPDQLIKKHCAVKDVVEGVEYEFRVSAVNTSGAGEPSGPSEFVIARDPKPPGKVIDLKVTDSTYTTLTLGWSAPTEEEGVQDEAKGYFVELRPAEDTEWSRCNSSPVSLTFFTIVGLKSMAMYWVRVVATNEGGDGEPQDLDNYIIAMPPPRPQITDRKTKNFMVVKAGNSARINLNFKASPIPTITWLKDGLPIAKHVTVSNTETSSQLMIPSSERHDTGIYTVIIKNIVGQETSSIEIRVTDPKPPGPVELEENVSGTVTISWTPSPDEKKDDRLHYMVTKHDSVKRTWQTVADHLFNNRFTVINIMPGRQYKFRVYAVNDMGRSDASDSAVWEIPESKSCNFEAPPSFSVPLKMHKSPERYECHMSCAVTGNPRPHVTWYKDNISLNTDSNYYITNTCGVCSMMILTVGPRDSGVYTVVAENCLGRVECATKLVIQ
uniref:Immunoglobulin like and fibronectin type III domain containing 1, tandem duplicate 3 n=1 Tax=Oryzias melastigma TaxID=30732 RepID=A0A3B3DI46_ORYME